MKNTTRRKKQADNRNDNFGKPILVIIGAFVVIILSIVVSFCIYDAYIDKMIYAERLSQMREVTAQLFSGLEDVVENEWRIVNEQCHALKDADVRTLDELSAYMDKRSQQGDFKSYLTGMIAIDSEGMYYTEDGRQGFFGERESLSAQPEAISFVLNSLTYNETRMVFVRRLDEPVNVQQDNKTISIRYYGIAQSMEALNPYFQCSAYGGNNSVYVVDDAGLKLFSSGRDNFLKGFNVYTILKQLDYLHGSTFVNAYRELMEHKTAYSNAVVDDTEIYYALYRMDHAAWTILFLVPSEYVARNTVELIRVTVVFVLIFVGVVVTVCMISVITILKAHQREALAVEQQNNTELEKLNQELVKASQAKSEFLANMSHDIRTPMNAIIGITKLMKHDKNNPDKLSVYLEKMDMSSRHLLSLINDVLDMSKIESGDIKLDLNPVRLCDVISQVENIIRPQAEEHGHEFSVSVHGTLQEYLMCDEVRLRQILINLLSNSVKYTPNGGKIAFDIERLSCEKPEWERIHFTVADNGYGMTQEFLKHIYEPFVRAENSTINKVQGTGLGMAITKKMVDLMQGTISVHSEPDKGSSFEIILELAVDHTQRCDAEAENAAESVPREEQDILRGMKFLCAEDNELNAEILTALLEIAGAKCVIYPDGEQIVSAFENARESDFDAILMDIQMPKMNGMEATKAIRNGNNPLGKTIPIIAMTANAFNSDVKECLDAGMNAHIPKPLDVTQLEKIIRNL